jgi:hypothetical protein
MSFIHFRHLIDISEPESLCNLNYYSEERQVKSISK